MRNLDAKIPDRQGTQQQGLDSRLSTHQSPKARSHRHTHIPRPNLADTHETLGVGSVAKDTKSASEKGGSLALGEIC